MESNTHTPVELPPPFGRLEALIRLALGFIVVAGCAVILMSIMVLLLPFRLARIRAGNVYGHLVGRAVLWIGQWVPEKVGFERLKDFTPAIYVSNHTSAMDIFSGMWLCPIGGCAVAKRELALVPFFGQAYWLAGHLLIDRGNRASAIAGMNKTAALVKENGLSIWMWPEGTRSRDGRLGIFKKGFAHMALATRLPIRPIIVHDAHRYWPARSFQVRPGPLRVELLDDIDTSEWSLENLDAHIDSVRQLFVEGVGPGQRPE